MVRNLNSLPREVNCRTAAYDTLHKNGEYLVFTTDDKKRKPQNANVSFLPFSCFFIAYFLIRKIPIPRQDLRRLLIEKIPRETIKWGKELQQITHTQDSKVQLEFTDGEKSIFDAVVGWYLFFLSLLFHPFFPSLLFFSIVMGCVLKCGITWWATD